MSETFSFMDPTGKIRALIERKDEALASSQARIQELESALGEIISDPGYGDPNVLIRIATCALHKDSK